MRFIDRAVDRPLPTFLGAFGVALLGLWCAVHLPVTRNPRVVIPYSTVVVTYPGATPEEVESEVTIKLEDQLNSLDRLRHLTSVSAQGVSFHLLQFEDRADMAESLAEVRDRVNLAKADFPDEAHDPIVREISLDETPIVFFTLTGGDDPFQLRDVAEELKPDLESVPGVAGVDVFGGYEREVRVRADPATLVLHGLTLEDLAAAIQRQDRSLPAGQVRRAGFESLIRATGEFERVEDIGSAILSRDPQGPLRVEDVARVELWHKRLTSGSWLDGEPSVTLMVRRRPEVNTLETVSRLRERVEALRPTLPDGVRIEVASSTARVIRTMLRQLGTSALLGAVLVVGVLFVMFGARQALLVALVLPFSLLGTALGLYAFDMTLSDMSLFSLILVLGLVVDGGIIVGESIYSQRERGLSSSEAAKRGIARVGIPVLSADLTTIAAFLPMLLMVGVMGQYMAVLPKVVIFALLGSILVDHLLLPAAAARFGISSRRVGRHLAPDGLPWFSPELPRMKRLYLRGLEAALRHRAVVVTASLGAFLLALALLFSGVLESVFLPAVDRGRFTVDYSLPHGTSLSETNRIGARIGREIGALPEVDRYVLTTGDTGALRYDTREGGRVGPRFGRFSVELVERSQRVRSEAQVVRTLRERLAVFAGVEIDFQELSQGPPVGAALALEIQGRRLEDLEAVSREVRRRIQALPNARDVRVDYERTNPEVRVELDRARASGLFGVSPETVSRALWTAFQGVKVGRMWLGSERVDIRVEAAPRFTRTVENVSELGIRSRTGEIVPLGMLARVRRAFGHDAIFRRDAARTVTVRANPAEGTSSVALERAARAALAGLSLPRGVRLVYSGETEERDRSYASLWRALQWALALIFLILAVQFDSLLQPWIVICTIPLSIVGVVCGLLATGTPFSFMVFIGIVALTGIVVNDGIVLIDAINQGRKAGMPVYNAIRDAAMSRLRPVLLTTVTTIFGLLPLTLQVTSGGEFWVPLGLTVISGLLVASVLTLIFVPVLYSLLEPGSRRIPGEQGATEGTTRAGEAPQRT
ncbi:MAG: efflux RND transporter permease subunit [Myxococcota bacterium]